MNDPNEKTLLVGPRIWRANRLRYPGWVIAPKTVRWSVWHATENWVAPIAEMGSDYTALEKLFAFRELNWRLEIALFPMFSDFARRVEELLGELDPNDVVGNTLEFPEYNPTPQGTLPEERLLYADLDSTSFEYRVPEIKASWKELAFGLLRFAREERNVELFGKWKAQIKSNFSISTDETARICYEESLWGLSHLDCELVDRSLRAWPKDTSLVWRMRQVSILLQVGEIDEAAVIARGCYERIQQTARNQHSDLTLISLEAWNAMVLSRIQYQLRFPKENPHYDSILHANVKQRISQLARMKYDPWQLLGQFGKVAELEPPSFSERTVHTGFHPSERSVTHHVGRSHFKALEPAYEILRFSEEAGYPPQFTGQSLCAESVKAGALWLIPHDPIRTDSVLFHLKDEKLTQEYLSRHQVAALSDERLNNLYSTAKSGLKKLLESPQSSPASIAAKPTYIQRSIKTALDVINTNAAEGTTRNPRPIV